MRVCNVKTLSALAFYSVVKISLSLRFFVGRAAPCGGDKRDYFVVSDKILVVLCASCLGRDRGFKKKKKKKKSANPQKKKRKKLRKKKKKKEESLVSSGQICNYPDDDAHEKEKSIRAPLQSPRHKRRARARSIDACARTNARKERGRERRKERERDLQEWVTRCAFIYTLFSFFFFFARCGSFFFVSSPLFLLFS